MRRPDRPRPVRVVLALVVALAAGGCAFPRDAKGTLETIRSSGQLRLGVTEAPPWVVRTDDGWGGATVQLVRELADEVGAEVTFIEGTQDELLEALERHALDMVAAGLAEGDPWGSRVTFTPPIAHSRLVVASPSGDPVDDLADREVLVEQGTVAEALLRTVGATPRPVAALPEHPEGLVAVEDWRLDSLGLTATPRVLLEEAHVLALPTGENAWLTTVQDFLASHEPPSPSELEVAS